MKTLSIARLVFAILFVSTLLIQLPILVTFLTLGVFCVPMLFIEAHFAEVEIED